jgi:hypothetical protein
LAHRPKELLAPTGQEREREREKSSVRVTDRSDEARGVYSSEAKDRRETEVGRDDDGRRRHQTWSLSTLAAITPPVQTPKRIPPPLQEVSGAYGSNDAWTIGSPCEGRSVPISYMKAASYCC